MDNSLDIFFHQNMFVIVYIINIRRDLKILVILKCRFIFKIDYLYIWLDKCHLDHLFS